MLNIPTPVCSSCFRFCKQEAWRLCLKSSTSKLFVLYMWILQSDFTCIILYYVLIYIILFDSLTTTWALYYCSYFIDEKTNIYHHMAGSGPGWDLYSASLMPARCLPLLCLPLLHSGCLLDLWPWHRRLSLTNIWKAYYPDILFLTILLVENKSFQ